jgi:hypothetical protein
MIYKKNSSLGDSLSFTIGAQDTTWVSWDISRGNAWFESGDMSTQKDKSVAVKRIEAKILFQNWYFMRAP